MTKEMVQEVKTKKVMRKKVEDVHAEQQTLGVFSFSH